MDFCTIDDVTSLYRALTQEERDKATALIPVVSARLRTEANKRGKDLDEMISNMSYLGTVAKQVTVDIIARTLMTPTTGAPMTQMSESALGFTVSGTYLSPGGGLFIKNLELKALGITRQKLGTINMIGCDPDGF